MLRAATQLLDAVAIAANAAGTLLVLALVVVVNFDVVARGVFNAPFLGAVEVVQFSMVLIVFLQLPDVVRVGRLTRSEGMLTILRGSRPGAAGLLSRILDLVATVMMGLIAVAMWPEFVAMWRSADYFGVPGIFTAPWWPLKLAIFFGAALSALLFAVKALRPAGTTP